mgnify:CR=1 FL=1
MSDHSAIQWTEATWNPWHGCHKISPGCAHCYMFSEKVRYGQEPNIVVRSKTTRYAPLKWGEPKMVFTCSWSDWFIEEADEWRGEAWEIIRRTPQHTYQILTKRPRRALKHLPDDWPLPNVWLGVSVENQRWLERIDVLKDIPAAVRFVSFEPLLEDLGAVLLDGIRWAIIGGESGSKARPFDVMWARSLIRQCREQRVPCFVKQLGSKPHIGDYADIVGLRDRKGGDMAEWPFDLRVREYPERLGA